MQKQELDQKNLTKSELGIIEHVNDVSLEFSSVLGLDFQAGQIYMNLLRTGPTTTGSLTKEMKIDRNKIYRKIEELVSVGFVSMTLSSPKLCIPLDPENAIELVLQKKKKDIDKINKIKKDIIRKIDGIVSAPFGTSIPTFRVIQGLNNVYLGISASIEHSKDTVYIVTSIKDVVRMYHSDIPEKIKICRKNGGRVFLITDSNEKKMIPYIKRLNATEVKIGKLPSNGRILAFENKQMFMSDSTNAIDFMDESSDISLCTDATEMTSNIFKLCQFLWNVAIPMKLK
ncbi:MAG: TrmB family transcriptional regulator [Thaumarchaeota archaeon]|nr:TrmB family transcriptional regulator [Nitrososphaerota archaeon]